MRKLVLLAFAAELAVVSAAAEQTMMALSEDGTAVVVTVPAGCQTGCKLELAYDNSVGSASKYYLADHGADRTGWATAHTLTENLPAEGGTFTVPFAELGVPADACFRLFATGSFAVLDYAWIDANNAWIDTGVKDTDVIAFELGFQPTSTANTYAFTFGSLTGNGAGVSLQHSNGKVGVCNTAYFSRWTDSKYTYSDNMTFDTSKKNTLIFRDNALTLNGSGVKAAAGAKKWVTNPVGLSGRSLHLGCIADLNSATGKAKWYGVRFWNLQWRLAADYVPVKWNDVVGFFDQATGKIVTPTGGGTLTAGNVVAEAGTKALAVGDIQVFPLLAKTAAKVTIDRTDGVKLNIEVHPGYGAGSTLYLASGTAGDLGDLNAWSEREVLAESIPAAGGTYTVDLVAKGLDTGRIFRVFAGGRYTPLERVQLDSDDDVIDTGIRDYLAYRLEIGHTPTGYANNYGCIFGSGSGSSADPGFRLCHGGSVNKMAIIQDSSSKYTYKYYDLVANVYNVFRASGNSMSYNGSLFSPQSGNVYWTTSPLGTSGRPFLMGRLYSDAATGKGAYGWWYALWMRNADEQLILDYQPVKNSANVAGFFDRARGVFVTPTGGGALVAGAAQGDEQYLGMAITETMTLDDQVPLIASWIGGNSRELDNVANWACTNALGAALANVLPRKDVTAVTFSGSLAFDFAATNTALWGTVTFRDCTLVGDCDWSGFGVLPLDGTINIQGHKLALMKLPKYGTITDASSGVAGQLRVVVPEGETIENIDVSITGNVRLIKDGAGRLIATKYPQTYAGGTDIVAGTLQAGVPGTINKTDRSSFFGSALTVDVESAGTLDIYGTYYWGYHKIYLHGGTLCNSYAPGTYGFNSEIHLTADSRFDAIATSDLSTTVFDLGGHTLTCTVPGSNWFLFRSTPQNGKIVVSGSGTFNIDKDLDCSTCSFDISTRFAANGKFVTVNDLTIGCPSGGVSGNVANVLAVKGRFTPVTHNFPNVQLQDGATLDITACDWPWSAASAASGYSLSFAANATVSVDTGDKLLAQPKLVGWNEANPPAGADTLKVVSNRPKVTLTVGDDGIYCVSGIVIICR